MKATIGQTIAIFRKRAGITQEELAEKCAVTPQAVSKWENDLSYPDLESTGRLASILGCTVDALLNGEDAPASVRLKKTDDVGRRMLVITVSGGEGAGEFSAKARIPAELALLAEESGVLLELVDGNEDALRAVAPALELLRQGAVGPVVEVNTEGTSVLVEVIGDED